MINAVKFVFPTEGGGEGGESESKLQKRGLPGENDFVVTARRGAPLAAGYWPLVFAVAGPFGRGPRADGVERGYQVRRTVGNVMDTRDGGLVYVHRMGVLETRVSRAEQVDQNQIVLHEHRHCVRFLNV